VNGMGKHGKVVSLQAQRHHEMSGFE